MSLQGGDIAHKVSFDFLDHPTFVLGSLENTKEIERK